MTLAFSYIRFSSAKQEEGDSLRRQTEAAADYAHKHKLTLDARSYKDLGVSAAKSKNATEGELGTFIKAIDDGKLPQGSYLLVEDFDRLSRAPVMTALHLLQTIINKGVTVVTLNDGKRYSTETLNSNWTDLVVALSKMSSAHEENAKKGMRVREAWEAKRKSGAILTANGPAWLTLRADRKKWDSISEKVKAVQYAFKLAYSGLGSPSIADVLNKESVPTMLKAPNWEPGVVMALLKNKSVIGTYTPKKAKADPIDGYYPQIITPEVFYAVQDMIKKRNKSGGRKGDNVANLFSGLMRCECGSKMRYVSSKKPHYYVQCLKAYSNVGCDAPQIPYSLVEEEIMQCILTWEKLPLDNTVQNPTVLIKGQLEEKRQALVNFTSVIAQATSIAAPAVLLAQAVRLEGEVADLEQQLREYTEVPTVSASVKHAVLLWRNHQRMVKTADPAIRELRLRLQAECRRMLTKVVLNKTIYKRDLGEGVVFEANKVVLYGPVVDANPFESAPFFTADGGWFIEYQLPKWGFGRTRIKAAV